MTAVGSALKKPVLEIDFSQALPPIPNHSGKVKINFADCVLKGGATTSMVYRTQVQAAGKTFALALKVMIDEGCTQRFDDEVATLQALHKNGVPRVTSLIDVLKKRDELLWHRYVCLRHYVLVFLDHGLELEKAFATLPPYKFEQVVLFAKNLFGTMAAAIKANIVHRDLNDGNVVVGCDYLPTVIDWGFSHAPCETTDECTMITFRAPELFFSKKSYSAKSDSWALGCNLVLFATSQKKIFAWDAEDEEAAMLEQYSLEFGLPSKSFFDQLHSCKPGLFTDPNTFRRMPKGKPTLCDKTKASLIAKGAKETEANAFVDLVFSNIFLWDPTKRIDPENALRHPFFTGTTAASASSAVSASSAASASSAVAIAKK